MLFTIFSVFYVLVAVAMTVLILMQRGEGADAGASFGGGSSGTVFGARGSASFLSRATAVLAAVFFILSLGMGIYLNHHGAASTQKQTLGVMAGGGTAQPAKKAAPAAAASAPAPAVPVQHSEVPVAPGASPAAKSKVPAAANPAVPASPAKATVPAPVPAPASSSPSPSY